MTNNIGCGECFTVQIFHPGSLFMAITKTGRDINPPLARQTMRAKTSDGGHDHMYTALPCTKTNVTNEQNRHISQ